MLRCRAESALQSASQEAGHTDGSPPLPCLISLRCRVAATIPCWMVAANKKHVKLSEGHIARAKEQIAKINASEADRFHVQRHLIEGQVLAVDEVELKVVAFHHYEIRLIQGLRRTFEHI